MVNGFPGWVLVLVSFGFPLLLIRLRMSMGWVRKINPIIACYIVGIIMANTGMVGESAAASLDLTQTAAVALSIPLLLFTVDLSRSRHLTGRAGLSMAIAAGSIVLVVSLAHVIFRGTIAESAKVAGMVVGVYTGGTPNLAAISRALSVSQGNYLAVHTADLVLSALYLLFIMTIAKRLLSIVLPSYRLPLVAADGGSNGSSESAGPAADIAIAPQRTRRSDQELAESVRRENDAYSDLLKAGSIKGLLASLGLALVVGGIGGAVFFIAPADSAMLFTILALTTLSLAVSFIPAVRNMKMSYPLGQFLILVFCVSVGALADLKVLVQAAPSLFLFVAFCLFGSFLLHVIVSRMAGIDADTVLITSTAAICSPPFVPLTAAAIGNRDLIAPGITTGILGYALGNYLGVFVARMLEMLG